MGGLVDVGDREEVFREMRLGRRRGCLYVGGDKEEVRRL